MELALLVYAVSLLAKLQATLIITTLICFLLGGVWYIFTVDTAHGNDLILGKRTAKQFFVVALVSTALLVSIPSEKTAYMMVGAYAAQKVAEDPKVQQLSGKVLTIVEQKLDSIIEETTEKKSK